MPKREGLTPLQIQTIAALMQSRSIEQAAQKVGVSKRAVFRWLNQPAFQAALRQATEDAIAQAVRRLSALSGDAIDTLAVEMTNATTPPSTRVRAADVILSRLMNLKELSELEARVAALEEIVKGESQ